MQWSLKAPQGTVRYRLRRILLMIPFFSDIMAEPDRIQTEGNAFVRMHPAPHPGFQASPYEPELVSNAPPIAPEVRAVKPSSTPNRRPVSEGLTPNNMPTAKALVTLHARSPIHTLDGSGWGGNLLFPIAWGQTQVILVQGNVASSAGLLSSPKQFGGLVGCRVRHPQAIMGAHLGFDYDGALALGQCSGGVEIDQQWFNLGLSGHYGLNSFDKTLRPGSAAHGGRIDLQGWVPSYPQVSGRIGLAGYLQPVVLTQLSPNSTHSLIYASVGWSPVPMLSVGGNAFFHPTDQSLKHSLFLRVSLKLGAPLRPQYLAARPRTSLEERVSETGFRTPAFPVAAVPGDDTQVTPDGLSLKLDTQRSPTFSAEGRYQIPLRATLQGATSGALEQALVKTGSESVEIEPQSLTMQNGTVDFTASAASGQHILTLSLAGTDLSQAINLAFLDAPSIAKSFYALGDPSHKALTNLPEPLLIGGKIQLSATGGDQSNTWSSLTPDTLSIDTSGVVTLKQAGKKAVAVSCHGYQTSLEIPTEQENALYFYGQRMNLTEAINILPVGATLPSVEAFQRFLDNWRAFDAYYPQLIDTSGGMRSAWTWTQDAGLGSESQHTAFNLMDGTKNAATNKTSSLLVAYLLPGA